VLLRRIVAAASADLPVASQRLAPAFMQQPLLTARVCEACIRSSPDRLLPLLVAVGCCQSLVETEAFSNVVRIKADAAAALAATDGQQVQQQLWSLFMSCFKAEIVSSSLAGGSTQASGGPSQRLRQLATERHDYTATLYFAAEALLHRSANDSSSSSSSSRSSSGGGSSSKKGQGQLCCWLVFAARYLRFQCKELVAAAAAEPAASGPQEDIAAAAAPPAAAAAAATAASSQQQEVPSAATSAAAAAVPATAAAAAASQAHESALSWVLHPGYQLVRVHKIGGFIAQQLRPLSKQQPELSAVAAAGTLGSYGHLQPLLKQYGPMLEELERKALEVCKAEHEPCTTRQEALLGAIAAVGPQLLQQVLHFAEGVCAALPLRHCCNNPGCVNLGGLSEAGLVAGAGSRCSRCRACYYCSRECQLAAWPLHKPVCKQLQAAATAAAEASPLSATPARQAPARA
jgi:hypothetical protein